MAEGGDDGDDGDDSSSDRSPSRSSRSSQSHMEDEPQPEQQLDDNRPTNPTTKYGGLSRADVIRPTLKDFRAALDFRTYRLRRTDQTYSPKDSRNLPSFKKKMMPEMEHHTFDGKYPIRILDFLASFRRACDGMGVHEGAALFLFAYFLKGIPENDLVNRIQSDPGKNPTHRTRREDILTSYCQVVNYLLRTYADNQTISNTNAEIVRLTQRDDQSPIAFKNYLWQKMTRCGCVYSQDQMINYFTEGCKSTIRSLVRRKLEEDPTISLTKLADYAKDIDQRPDGTRWTDENDENRRRSRKRRGSEQATSTPLFNIENTKPSTSQPPPQQVNATAFGQPATQTQYRRPNNNSPPNTGRPQIHPTRMQIHPSRMSPHLNQTSSPPHQNPTGAPQFPQRRANVDDRQVNFRNQRPRRPSMTPEEFQAALDSMNSGRVCRICMSPDHVTSDCPCVINRAEFVETRDRNYQAARDAGLLDRISPRRNDNFRPSNNRFSGYSANPPSPVSTISPPPTQGLRPPKN